MTGARAAATRGLSGGPEAPRNSGSQYFNLAEACGWLIGSLRSDSSSLKLPTQAWAGGSGVNGAAEPWTVCIATEV